MADANEDKGPGDAGQPTLWKDPDLYRRLSEPFETSDAADAAIAAFNDDLRAIRAKHKIPDVYAVILGSVRGPDGTPGEFILSSHHGDSLKAEMMAAWALGYEQSARQERIYGLTSGRSVKQPRRGK